MQVLQILFIDELGVQQAYDNRFKFDILAQIFVPTIYHESNIRCIRGLNLFNECLKHIRLNIVQNI